MALYDLLRASLANTFAMYFMAHSAHWNVRSDDFPQLHAFFKDLYSELFEAVDDIAEHIRAVGGMAPYSLSTMIPNVMVEEMSMVYTAEGMLRGLASANQVVISTLTAAYVASDKNYGMQNFIADRLDVHSKWGWMLDAMISK